MPIGPAQSNHLAAGMLFRGRVQIIRTVNQLSAMNCTELANRIEAHHPDANLRDVARLVLLLVNSIEDIEQLDDDDRLATAWQDVNLRMQANADQYAAMTEEFDNLARSDPKKFTADQIWSLIRAIKVQSQILQMYIGDQTVSV